MPLGTEVNLGSSDVVLDGAPSFRPMSIMVIRLDGYQDATWYGSRPRSRPDCVRRGPSSPSESGTALQLPLFGPCRSPISAAAELLSDINILQSCAATRVRLVGSLTMILNV